ncbi:MAG: hypothetical protein V4660_20625 [Pseudomonadota bacterium]
MTALALFGICIATVVALLVLLVAIAGGNALMLVIIFPAIAAEAITGERGLEFNRKSFVYTSLFYLFILMQLLALAAVFFGFYCLFFGFPLAAAEAAAVTAANIPLLLLINKILLALISYFILRFIYSAIRYRARFKDIKDFRFHLHRVALIISFPLALIYLLACHKYLLNLPNAEAIGLLPKIASFVYAAYLIYSVVTTVTNHIPVLQHGISSLPFNHWVSLFIGLVYDVTFLYFFSQINLSF